MLQATLLAALGGLMWAFGALGKRIGVEGAPSELKQIRSACTIFVYTVTTCVPTICIFIEKAVRDPDALKSAFQFLSPRIPWIMLCGVISGLGGVLGTLAFAWSAGANSALISMVENGVYTMAGAALLAVIFHNYPGVMDYVAALLILLGIVLAQFAPGRTNKSKAQVGDDSDSNISRSASESTESSGSDDEELGLSAKQQRLWAVLLACLAGIGWGFGPVGKTYGVRDSPSDTKVIRSLCTYSVYMACTVVVPLGKLICSDPTKRKATFKDPGFCHLMIGTMLCGFISGIGGLISTYAFSQDPDHNPLISMVENGVYTVGGALLIAVTFREAPTVMQLCSAGVVVTGILVSSLS